MEAPRFKRQKLLSSETSSKGRSGRGTAVAKKPQSKADRMAADILKRMGLKRGEQLLDTAKQVQACQDAVFRGDLEVAEDIAKILKKQTRGLILKWWWKVCWAYFAQEGILGQIEGSYSAHGPGQIDEAAVRAHVMDVIDHWWVRKQNKKDLIECLLEHAQVYRNSPKKLQGDEEENRAKACEWAANEAEKHL